ncbi:hypothetical protein DMP17_22080 [Pseudonocardia sp. TMWB2A]|uniref:hypothetical protein n=1 Tax=Pseudonocardia sp. TMWB2A TaxID=687430 RepID=UPI00307EEF1E
MADRPPLRVPEATAQHAVGTRRTTSRSAPSLTDAFCDTCGVIAGPLWADEASAWVWGHLAAGLPSSLPAVLSSVEDVARVCEAAGLTRWAAQPSDAVTPIWRGGDHDGVVMFQVHRVLVYHAVLRAVPVIVPMTGWPAAVLYAAIQAARGGEPG